MKGRKEKNDTGVGHGSEAGEQGSYLITKDERVRNYDGVKKEGDKARECDDGEKERWD